MAGESETGGRQDVDISTGKGIGGEAPQSTQTQKTETTEDGKTKPEDGTGEGTGKEGGTDSEEKGEGKDDVNPDTGKPFTAEEWRDKFRNSARGAQELLDKNTVLANESKTKDEQLSKLVKDMEELKKIAEGKNPEGVSALELQRQLSDTTTKLALLTEERELDAFERKEPLATSKREALRSLARANPKENLQKLWDDNLKAGAVAEDKIAKDKKVTQEKGAGEKGKGTSTREHTSGGDTVKGKNGDTGLTLAEFNAKPVAERRALMEKYGIQ